MMKTEIIQVILSAQFVSTLLICGLLFATRAAVLRWIKMSPAVRPQLKEKVSGHIKSLYTIAFMVSMLYVWGEQAQSLVISLFVLASACAWAGKELISSLSGSAMRIRGHAFEVGDHIEMGSVKGYVIDTNLITTSVLESEGRRVTFSNGKLLQEAVFNENLVEGFCFEVVKVSIARTENWKLANQLLMDIANEQAAPFIDAARRRLSEVEKKRKTGLPACEPRVSVDMSDSKTIGLRVRLLVPVAMKEKVRSALMHTFLDRFYPICSVNDLLEKKIPAE